MEVIVNLWIYNEYSMYMIIHLNFPWGENSGALTYNHHLTVGRDVNTNSYSIYHTIFLKFFLVLVAYLPPVRQCRSTHLREPPFLYNSLFTHSQTSEGQKRS